MTDLFRKADILPTVPVSALPSAPRRWWEESVEWCVDDFCTGGLRFAISARKEPARTTRPLQQIALDRPANAPVVDP
ncbi:hypothetical protein [Streptomyces sp. NBC_00154]|uniref:hypothetical protein n=1 Tax=Streptomyces sp. NBC_00154 TaxID=2975670 RepID=UPI002250DB86|nr:hypothetical protein [Streptomyces sp. NBC_00154]MCX5316828.1 hypothetical protein [Streptomyces sp. NBC_00154]